jgi:hypothetical protein
MPAQVYEVRGGNSSLYQADGGSLTVSTSGYNFVLGAGMYAGHFESGARLEEQVHGGLMIVGDDHLDFRLPTDVFNSSQYLYTRGLSMKTRLAGTDALFFAGVDSTTFSNPLFLGAKTGSALGFLSLHRQVASHWQLFSDTVISNRQSEIVALQWRPRPGIEAALATGVGANAPYGAGSFCLKRSWLDLKTSYVQAGREFHRFVLTSPTLAEATKGNLLVTISPTHFFSLNGGVQNYLIPLNPTSANVDSSSREIGIDSHFLKAAFAATLYESKFEGEVDHATSAILQRSVARRVHLASNYTVSRPHARTGSSSWMSTVDEVLTPRLSVSQSLVTSGGKPTIYFGGELQSNLVSVSANYETFYVPTRTNPFENALMLDLKIHMFGRSWIHGQTSLGPTGRLLYTADAYGMAARDESARQSSGDTSLGRSLLRVQAVDTTGFPIEGAAVLVDQRLAYTDSTGCLFIREHKPQSHVLTVALDQFLDYKRYEVVSAPQTVASSRNEELPPAVVVLRRVNGPARESQIQ